MTNRRQSIITRTIAAAGLCAAVAVQAAGAQEAASAQEAAKAQEKGALLGLHPASYRSVTLNGKFGVHVYAHCNADGTLFAWGPSWSGLDKHDLIFCSGEFRVEHVYVLSDVNGKIYWDEPNMWLWTHNFQVYPPMEACGRGYWPLTQIHVSRTETSAELVGRPTATCDQPW